MGRWLQKPFFAVKSDKDGIARRDECCNWPIAHDVLVSSMDIDHFLTATYVHNILTDEITTLALSRVHTYAKAQQFPLIQ